MKHLLIILSLFIITSCSSSSDPYEEGAHWNYTIFCEGGFKYKLMSERGTILLLNTDGTPLKCNEKRH